VADVPAGVAGDVLAEQRVHRLQRPLDDALVRRSSRPGRLQGDPEPLARAPECLRAVGQRAARGRRAERVFPGREVVHQPVERRPGWHRHRRGAVLFGQDRFHPPAQPVGGAGRARGLTGQRLADRGDDALVGAPVWGVVAGRTAVDEAAQSAVAVAVPHPLDGDRARRRACRGQLRGFGRLPLPDGPQAWGRTPGAVRSPAPRWAAARSRPRRCAVPIPVPARRPLRARRRAGARPATARRLARCGRSEDREPRRREQVAQQHNARCAVRGDQPHPGSGERDHLVLDIVELDLVADIQQLHHAATADTSDVASSRAVRSACSNPVHSRWNTVGSTAIGSPTPARALDQRPRRGELVDQGRHHGLAVAARVSVAGQPAQVREPDRVVPGDQPVLPADLVAGAFGRGEGPRRRAAGPGPPGGSRPRPRCHRRRARRSPARGSAAGPCRPSSARTAVPRSSRCRGRSPSPSRCRARATTRTPRARSSWPRSRSRGSSAGLVHRERPGVPVVLAENRADMADLRFR
jgi:hypothetical protein